MTKLFNDPNLVEYSCDIVKHKYYLSEISADQTVVELGVRCGFSSVCFLMTCKKLISYDIVFTPQAQILAKQCPSWTFYKADSLSVEIPECDILFIDTEHTYSQLSAELRMHNKKVAKKIIMHDTNIPQVRLALIEFLSKNKEWQTEYETQVNNGLTTLHRA